MDVGALTVALFRPEDAEGIAELFTDIYGDGYPAKMVYHPDQLISAFEKRDNIPIVCPYDRQQGRRLQFLIPSSAQQRSL